MLYSRLFSKTLKNPPHEADSANAKYLAQGGFVRQEMAGVYSWLPLGLRVLRKVEAIIREEMNGLDSQEILMPAFASKDAWVQTGRWDTVDILFKVKSQTGKEMALGASHEEVVTPLVKAFLGSYKELPISVFQIQTKYRDELRAKSGVLRGREFGMKDMYSFHATDEDLKAYYARVREGYGRVFKRCGLDARVVEASGGIFTKNPSHEFQVLTDAGEDEILVCTKCEFAQNAEVAEKVTVCPACGADMEVKKGIEAGNIFDLGTKYSDVFDVTFSAEDGTRQTALMGCYGIGTTRLVGTIVEASHDDKGMIWPMSVAPFPIHLITLKGKTEGARVQEVAQELYDDWQSKGVEVLWDDRDDVSAGAKFADADLVGLPIRLVISEKTLKEESVEWKERTGTEARLVKLEDLTEEIQEAIK